ncbi:hypothetical protein OG342_25620 [Streptomyces bobili]|uniref:hypothetical protein n=1 Tax=Streptomyces bobili TaxID=67280 RepID=UPI00224E05FD|nr:hypothetical protein [Streptomyces bobili]MCX5526192.1 hypothetical protein [Streptomyces bobili]
MADHSSAIPLMSLLSDVQALALSGDATRDSYKFGSTTVVIGNAGTVVIVEAGDALDRSSVWNAEEVRLLGPAPTPVRGRLVDQPSEWGTTDARLPVHLMARLPQGLVYLGTGTVAQAGTELRPGHAEHVLTDCVFRLDTPLSMPDLDRVRPLLPPPDLPGLEWLSNVNGNRATALEQFITGWYPTMSEALEPPSVPALTLDLPEGLRHFYHLSRRHPNSLGVQNRIFSTPKLRTDPNGMIIFGEENQGGFVWALPRTLDGLGSDPTVWFQGYGEPLIAEQEPLSGFLLQFALFEAAMGADYLALPHEPTAQQVQRLTEGLHPVPLRPFCPWYPTRFYVAPGLILHVSDPAGDDSFSVWAGATHRSALAPLADIVIEWNQFDG